MESVKEGREIDLFIASDFHYSVVKDGIIQLNNGTVAAEIRVGYFVCDCQHNASKIDSYFTNAQIALILTDEEHIKEPGLLFFNGYKMSPIFAKHELFSSTFFVQNPKTENYTASLPWTPECDKSKIPTYRNIAYNRARNMIEKTSTNKQLFQKLKNFYADYQRREFISLTINYNDDNCSYLPRHAAYKDSSIHTTVRIVFDASCKDKRLEKSLNDVPWNGSNLPNNLVVILLPFRLHRLP